MNLSKTKTSQSKTKASASDSSACGGGLIENAGLKEHSVADASPRLESFRLASQSLEEAIKGWAVVSQQCEDAKSEHTQVKKEIESLLKELQDKIKELS